MEQKDAAGTLCGLRHDRDHMTRDPGLAAAEDFGPSVPTGTLLRIGSCDPPGESSQKLELIGGNVPAGTSVPLGRLRAVNCKT